jgi:hypothetical protein
LPRLPKLLKTKKNVKQIKIVKQLHGQIMEKRPRVRNNLREWYRAFQLYQPAQLLLSIFEEKKKKNCGSIQVCYLWQERVSHMV